MVTPNKIKKPIVLYCCTFFRDLTRAIKLVNSVMKHNKDNIPLYLSVPEEDLVLFKQHLKDHPVNVFNEKEILRANPKLELKEFYQVGGGLRQQVIKSEFWRLGLAENYLVLDADCVFIRDFYQYDFLVEGSIPYSIIHEGRDVLQATERFGPKKNRQHFYNDREPIKKELGRVGILYDYGYAPFLWNEKVWAAFDEHYLTPRGMNFFDAILFCGSEFTWYGEALMTFKAIPIYPRKELFKCYHYEHQLWADQVLGYSEKILTQDYLGIVYQSYWNVCEHYGRTEESVLSRLWRRFKRAIKKRAFKARVLYKLI